MIVIYICKYVSHFMEVGSGNLLPLFDSYLQYFIRERVCYYVFIGNGSCKSKRSDDDVWPEYYGRSFENEK